MKKIRFLIVVLSVLSCSAFAQKSNWYLGGQVGFETIKNTSHTSTPSRERRETNFANKPEVGIFLADDIALGFGIAFNIDIDNDDTADTNFDIFTATSPFVYVRKFFSIEDIFSAFIGLDVNYSTGSFSENRNDVLTTTNKISGFGANVNIGITYPLGKRFTAIGKYGGFGYESLTIKDDAGNKQNSVSEFGFGVNSLGSVFNFGLYYTFVLRDD